MDTKKKRLKKVEGRLPAEQDQVKVIWHEIGQPDPEELIQARLAGERIVEDSAFFDEGQNEQDTEEDPSGNS